MNDAKQATPAAELERQICSATEPKNEREWWAHREIERLRDRLAVETLALVETIARAERAEAEAAGLRADIERLRSLCDDLYSDLLAAGSLTPHDCGAYSLIQETIRLRRDRWARPMQPNLEIEES